MDPDSGSRRGREESHAAITGGGGKRTRAPPSTSAEFSLIVEFINQRRRQGTPRCEALARAGRLRLRPILLTSITTIGGGFMEGSLSVPRTSAATIGFTYEDMVNTNADCPNCEKWVYPRLTRIDNGYGAACAALRFINQLGPRGLPGGSTD